ncbi:Hypothetical_protein [Hexamita inflata]|uniref:Hypothetical_protein n=1 Tax=Hexamita inflata TaxID=28002 RepID=A0AA86V487_9EUKA|nr:Hypothetical protein HINF_LOCUS63347 [Hexamita inflata]
MLDSLIDNNSLQSSKSNNTQLIQCDICKILPQILPNILSERAEFEIYQYDENSEDFQSISGEWQLLSRIKSTNYCLKEDTERIETLDFSIKVIEKNLNKLDKNQEKLMKNVGMFQVIQDSRCIIGV